VINVPREYLAVRKRRDVHASSGTSREKRFELCVSLRVHGTVARDGFDQEEPVVHLGIDDHIRQLSVSVQRHAEPREEVHVKITVFVPSVSHVNECAPSDEPRNKLFYDGLDEK
jgi:hypothetical protein